MRKLQQMVVWLVVGLAGTAAYGQYSVLHEFAGGSGDGRYPYGTLTLAGSILYGTTGYGGGTDYGTVFQINTDGNGFSLLSAFGGANGNQPYGALALSGSTLYGTTRYGGTGNIGTVFQVDTTSGNVNVLHHFAGGATDGSQPTAGLMLSGSTLYGTTYRGGANNNGTAFTINTSGGAFSLLHTFTGTAPDGNRPYGALTLADSTLYGMTRLGGTSNLGIVYKMNLDGSGFTILHEFAGGGGDGSNPYGELTLVSSTLYGMTTAGGDSNLGTVFMINTNGTGFTLLHEFAGGANDGSTPYGSLTVVDTALYGMTSAGGDNNVGTLFQIGTNGVGFSVLHDFVGGASDGSAPNGSLI